MRALAALSDLFKVPCDDLINPTVDPVKSYETEYFKLGKEIVENCDTHDLTAFLKKFQLYKQSEWVVAPKYDLVMVLLNHYMRDDGDEVTSNEVYYLIKNLKLWLVDAPEMERKDNMYMSQIGRYDGAGHLSIDDKRDPISLIDLLKELENMNGDLEGYFEIFENNEMGFSSWNYLES